LFLLKDSPFAHDYRTTLRLAALMEGAEAVFLQDGVYAVAAETRQQVLPSEVPLLSSFRRLLSEAQARGVRFYALREDMEARGLGRAAADGVASIPTVDYGGLLALILKHRKVL